MDPRTVNKYRRQLLELKQNILNSSKKTITSEELYTSSDDIADESDLTVAHIQQNLVFQLRDQEKVKLTQIEEALDKLEEGTFGVCEDCEDEIETKRLDVSPHTQKCIACQEKAEKAVRFLKVG